MSAKSELRLTDTNAASDSKGRTWGLEGGLFWWLIGGIGAGIIVFFVLLVVLNVSLAMSFVAALVPVLICLAYIFALRQGKPPGYDRDCFEYLTTRTRLQPAGRTQLQSSAFMSLKKKLHPLSPKQFTGSVELIPPPPRFVEFIDAAPALGLSHRGSLNSSCWRKIRSTKTNAPRRRISCCSSIPRRWCFSGAGGWN